MILDAVKEIPLKVAKNNFVRVFEQVFSGAKAIKGVSKAELAWGTFVRLAVSGGPRTTISIMGVAAPQTAATTVIFEQLLVLAPL